MLKIRKMIALVVVFVFLLIPISPTAAAASVGEVQHHHCENEGCDTAATVQDSQPTVEPRNLLCSIFGHKLTNYVVYYLGARMIDDEQCEVNYEDAGYCDRCSEYVMLLRTEVVDHDIKTSGNRIYCTYGCGYELWHLK